MCLPSPLPWHLPGTVSRMTDDYGYGVDADGIEQIPPYTQHVDITVRCNRCGALVDGTAAGQVIHDVWHNVLDARIDRARHALPTRYAGEPR